MLHFQKYITSVNNSPMPLRLMQSKSQSLHSGPSPHTLNFLAPHTSLTTSPTPLFYLVPAILISSLLLEYPALNWLLPLDCYNHPPGSNWAHSLIS